MLKLHGRRLLEGKRKRNENENRKLASSSSLKRIWGDRSSFCSVPRSSSPTTTTTTEASPGSFEPDLIEPDGFASSDLLELWLVGSRGCIFQFEAEKVSVLLTFSICKKVDSFCFLCCAKARVVPVCVVYC
jgi:hypothetical protein